MYCTPDIVSTRFLEPENVHVRQRTASMERSSCRAVLTDLKFSRKGLHKNRHKTSIEEVRF